jgi:hypothetical protein
MCNQAVGLIASVIEKAGIPTVTLSLLRMITERVSPPRSLIVPFPFGYPLGRPHNIQLQQQVILAALSLLESRESLPIVRDFEPSGAASHTRGSHHE